MKKDEKKCPLNVRFFIGPPTSPEGEELFLKIYTPVTSYLGVCHLVPEIVQIEPNLLEILLSRLKVLRQQGLSILWNSFNLEDKHLIIDHFKPGVCISVSI